MTLFHVGQKIVCVNSDGSLRLRTGHSYRVAALDGSFVVIDGVDAQAYASSRFVAFRDVEDQGLLAGDVSKSEAEGQGFYSPDTQKLFLLLKASRDRVQQLLDKNNDYLEEARKARRETESLRLTLAAVEAQRDHLAAIVAAAVSGNLKETLDHLTKTVMGDTK